MGKLKKKIILGVIIGIIVIFGAWRMFFLSNEEKEAVFAVEYGDIVREVFETGTVIRGEKAMLSFPASGKISAVNVQAGDKVKSGQILASLNNSELYFQIQEADEAIVIAKAQLEQLLEGATQKELDVYGALVEKAELAKISSENRLKEAKENLEEVKETSQSTLKLAINTVLADAKQATEAGKSALLQLTELQFKHFFSSTHKNLALMDAKTRAVALLLGGRDTSRWNVESIARLQDGVWKAVREASEEDEEEYLIELMEDTVEALRRVSVALDAIPISSVLSDAEKTLIQTEKNTMTAQLASMQVTEETLKGAILSSGTSVSSAKRAISSTEDALNLAEQDLEEAKLRLTQIQEPFSEQEKLSAEAKIRQAQARKSALSARVDNYRIFAPFAGTIANLSAQRGETAIAGNSILELIPEKSFQAEMFLYEGDIESINLGDEIYLELVAFPEIEYKGTIIRIEEGGVIINGVVHYRVLIEITDNMPKRTLPDMTVDIRINTVIKENALIIPEAAIERIDGEFFVQVIRKDGSTEERPITTGLRGAGRVIEVLDGLKENEKILIK